MEMKELAGVVVKEVTKEAVKTALGSLWKLLKYEWCLQDSVKEGLRSLKDELNYMQVCIENVSSGPQDQINRVDEIWLTNVKELSRTIETGLQSLVSRVESTKGTLLSAASKQYINHDIDRFIKKQMTKAKEVSEQRARYGFSPAQTNSAQKVDPRFYAQYTKESDLVDIPGETELTKLLSTCDHVSIVGMGGLGKTTLARRVYDKMKGDFQCCAFVPVGQNANVKEAADKVLTDILNDLRIEIYGRAPDTRQLVNRLRDSLKGRRFLFVIDDLWDKETWALIKCAFVAVGSAESRIITTTRNHKVAEAVGGVHVMQSLSLSKSKELLHARIFGAEAKSHDTEFARLSDRILSKCGGVPIAIITIASLLAKKPRDEWSKVYDSIGFAEHEEEDVVKDIRMIQSFSYFDLPCHLRKCFLYLSLFPKGHWIEKNMLIWRWVAEGLVPGCNEQRVGLFELGETYFNELIDRSMIQRAVSPRDLGQGGCRIHDMMLDIIRDLSSSDKENFSTVLNGKQESTSQSRTIHRLAIHGNIVDETQNNITTPQKNPNTSLEVGTVQSFYASSCPGSSLPRFSKLALMRVMDLEYCDLSVGDHKLKHLSKSRELAYVGLLGTPVAELPKKIGRLKLLQTLDVTGTGIKELPLFVCELKKLRCLRAGKGTRMLGRVGELTSLEELWLHSADKSPDFAAELRKLTQLRVLVIHFDEMVVGVQEELVESLSVLKKLQVLQVWFDTDRKVRLPCWEESVPFPKLRQLLLFGVIQLRPMPWIHYECVPELTKLLLEVEVLEAQDLEILGQMRSLLSLYLHSEAGNRLSYTAGKDEFKVLEYLYTNIELVCGDGALPRIQELEVCGIRVGTDVGLRGNMPLLERASYHLDCFGCVPVKIENAEAALRQAGEAHPNRPTISLKRFHDFAKLEMDVSHHIMESRIREVLRTLEPTFSDNLRLGGGDEAHANANSAISSLLYIISESLARGLRSAIARPTLTVGDATADGTSSTSQFAGGVPPRRPNGEGHVLLTTTYTSPFAEGKVPFSSDDWLAFVNREPTADVLSSMATQQGVDPAEFMDTFKKCARNPELIAVANNIKFDSNRSLSASDISTVVQLMVPEIIRQQVQKGAVLESVQDDGENICMRVKKLLQTLDALAAGASSGQPSSTQQPDNTGIEGGGAQ